MNFTNKTKRFHEKPWIIKFPSKEFGYFSRYLLCFFDIFAYITYLPSLKTSKLRSTERNTTLPRRKSDIFLHVFALNQHPPFWNLGNEIKTQEPQALKTAYSGLVSTETTSSRSSFCAPRFLLLCKDKNKDNLILSYNFLFVRLLV